MELSCLQLQHRSPLELHATIQMQHLLLHGQLQVHAFILDTKISKKWSYTAEWVAVIPWKSTDNFLIKCSKAMLLGEVYLKLTLYQVFSRSLDVSKYRRHSQQMRILQCEQVTPAFSMGAEHFGQILRFFLSHFQLGISFAAVFVSLAHVNL